MEECCEEYWEIEEYSEPYDKSEGKLGWIWRKGLSLGKKIVVTGVVISSAPFVLPPLVALSTIGFAFSVPAGFVFVTYACTDKLMDKLLPMPSPPPLLEGGTMYFDEEQDRVYGDDLGKGYKEYGDIEAEEKEYTDDLRKEIETRIELVEEGNYEIDYSLMPVSREELDRMRKVNEIVDEGYEEDVYVTVENQKQPFNSDAICEILEGIREAEDELSLMQGKQDERPTDSLQAVVVAAEVDGKNEDSVEHVLEELAFVGAQNSKGTNGHTDNFTEVDEDKMRKETTGLLVDMRDESKEHQKRQEGEGKEETNDHTDNFTEVDEDEMREETTGLLEKIRDESKEHQKRQEDERKEEIPIKDNQNSGNRNLFVIPEEVKPVKDVEEMTNGFRTDESNVSSVGTGGIDQTVNERKLQGDESSIIKAEPKPVVEPKLVVNVSTSGGHTTTDIRHGTSPDKKTGSDRKTGTLVLSNTDARETDESRFDLSDHETVPLDQIADSMGKRSKGEELSDEVYVDYHEVPIESTIPVSKTVHTATVHTATVHTALDQDATAGSNKVSLNEERLWEQIHAMRTIVGYKVTPQSSCVEELKALFVFTGVEPPISSKDPADLIDMNEKLHFLMSVVGVK